MARANPHGHNGALGIRPMCRSCNYRKWIHLKSRQSPINQQQGVIQRLINFDFKMGESTLVCWWWFFTKPNTGHENEGMLVKCITHADLSRARLNISSCKQSFEDDTLLSVTRIVQLPIQSVDYSCWIWAARRYHPAFQSSAQVLGNSNVTATTSNSVR